MDVGLGGDGRDGYGGRMMFLAQHDDDIIQEYPRTTILLTDW